MCALVSSYTAYLRISLQSAPKRLSFAWETIAGPRHMTAVILLWSTLVSFFPMIRKKCTWWGRGSWLCPVIYFYTNRFSAGHMTLVNKNGISQLPALLNTGPGLSSHLLDLSIPWQPLETFLKSHWVPCLAFYYLFLSPVAWTRMLTVTLNREDRGGTVKGVYPEMPTP